MAEANPSVARSDPNDEEECPSNPEEMFCLLVDYLMGLKRESPERFKNVMNSIFEDLGRESDEHDKVEPTKANEEPAKVEPKPKTLEEEARDFFEEERPVEEPATIPSDSENRRTVIRNMVQDRRNALLAKPSQEVPVAKQVPRPAVQRVPLRQPAPFSYPNPMGLSQARGPMLPMQRKNQSYAVPDKILGSVNSASKTCMACRGGI